jgi:hypothetical protein
MEAVVLTMLKRWAELGDVLPPLERIAARGSPYLEALVAAIREEMRAARGGPRADARPAARARVPRLEPATTSPARNS